MSIQLPTINLQSSGNPFTLNLQGVPLSAISWIEFLNESPYTLSVTSGGLNVPIPAWDDFPLQTAIKNNNNTWQNISGMQEPINVSFQLLGPNLTYPSYNLIPVLYLLGETPSTSTPRSLTRNTYVPNTVQTEGAMASTLVNDSSNAGSIIIETRVPGDSNTEFSVNNQGVVLLGMNANPNSILQLGYPTILEMWAAGNSALNGSWQIGVDVNGNLVFTSTANDNFEIVSDFTLTFNGVNGALKITTAPQVINGGVAGTATLYQVLTGTIKLVYVYLNGFEPGVSNLTIALPVAFTSIVKILTGGIGTSANSGGIALLKSSSAQTINVLTALSANGGTSSAVTTMYQHSYGQCVSGVDTIQFNANSSATHSGDLLLIGI